MGLEINRSKTKLMIIDRNDHLQLTNALADLEVVERFTYLGSMLSNTGGCEAEIGRRIGMAKSAMTRLDRIWKDRNISRDLKKKLVRVLVFSIFLYSLGPLERRRGLKSMLSSCGAGDACCEFRGLLEEQISPSCRN